MKLKSKLLPLTGIAAVAATVIPLTCCGNNQSTDDLNGYVDLLDKYTPQAKQYSGEKLKMTRDEANDYYCETITHNPDIVADDLYWSFADTISSYQRRKAGETKKDKKKALSASMKDDIEDATIEWDGRYNGTPTHHLVRVSDINVDYALDPYRMEYGEGWGYDVALVSFIIEYDYQYYWIPGVDSPTKEGSSYISEREMTGYTSFVNIPFKLGYFSEAELWYTYASEDIMFSDKWDPKDEDIWWNFWKHRQWSVESNFVVSQTTTTDSELTGPTSFFSITESSYNLNAEQVHKNKFERATLDYVRNYILEDCSFNSWHMYGVGRTF